MRRGDSLYPVAGVPSPIGLLDVRGVARFLAVSPRKVADLIAQGLPVIDLGTHDPRLRRKRLLRFDPAAVLAWARARGQGEAGGNGADGR